MEEKNYVSFKAQKWKVLYYYRKEDVKRNCQAKKSEALIFLRDFKEKLHPSCEISLKDFKQFYIEHSYRIHANKTTKKIQMIFEFLERHLGNINLSQISKAMLNVYIIERSKVSVHTSAG